MFVGATPDVEVSRSTVNLASAPIALGKPVTDAQGAYSAQLPSLPSGSYLVEAWFRGGSALFPSYASARVSRP